MVKSSISTPLTLSTLAFGAFVAQTTEYLPIGLLSQISDAFKVSDARVGLLVTGYAWIAAITAIPFTLLTRKMERRKLYLLLLLVVTLANVLSAISPNYWALAIFRIIVALTHGVFWSIIAAFAMRASPNMAAGRATAWVFFGISLAVVGGVPFATAVGQSFGWRISFGIFAALGFVGIIAGTFLLPILPAHQKNHHSAAPVNNKPLYGAALVTGLSLTAHFCAYTYIVPLLKSVARVPISMIPLVFLVFGVAGLVGNAGGGWLSRKIKLVVAIAILGIVFSQLTILIAGRAAVTTWFAMTLWGASITMLIVGLQSWILEIAPHQADAASALYVATFNGGIGLGALTGGLALDYSGPSLVIIMGIICGTTALLSLAVNSRIRSSA
ncbi:MFS transporter [Sodalis sp. RH20]|uniref:MFS transporter n=1 Tax=unclassified Sodalis (in: enterobacteria) TaxID=2636512 RepID=UPI0039B47FD7